MHSRLEAFRAFLETDPDDAFTRYALALELAAHDDLPQAVLQLEETLRRHPDYIPAYHQLAQIQHRSGRDDDAIANYRRGIEAARTAGDAHAAREMSDELDELLEELS